MHVAGDPVLLYNAWDAGSAKAIVEAGASAIASSSWSVAEAQGFRDGEELPLEVAEQIIARIAATVDVPVTADFEGGYSEDDVELADNAARLFETGVIGINFEDRVVKGAGLYELDRQAEPDCRHSPRGRPRSVSTCSSTPAPTCSSVRVAIPRPPSMKRSSGPRPTPPRAPRVSSSPVWKRRR